VSTQQEVHESVPERPNRRKALLFISLSLLVVAGLFGALLGVSTSPGRRSGTGVAGNRAPNERSASSPSSSTSSLPSGSVSGGSEPGGSVPYGSVPGESAPGGAEPSATDLADAKAMLVNEEEHGWDACYNGLSINWADVNGTNIGNWNGTGHPDPSPCTRHEDRMTTLRFLDGLLLYRADTGSTEFDGEINKIEPHVLTLFTTANADPRGWAYDTVVQIGKLSGDPEFTTIAQAMLNQYATRPADNSRPDWQIEEASALVQSGVPSNVALGTAELNQYWKAYYLPSVGLVNEPNGIVTTDQGDMAIALARAGFTTEANQVLSGVVAHLWDAEYGGFGEGAVYSNGSLSLKMKKTGGRMMNMMQLGKILDDSTLVSTMDRIFQQHIYQSSPEGYQGVLYEQQPDWALYTLGGTTENWVTSEAMGITYIALLSHG
jgi:hypothetical protein